MIGTFGRTGLAATWMLAATLAACGPSDISSESANQVADALERAVNSDGEVTESKNAGAVEKTTIAYIRSAKADQAAFDRAFEQAGAIKVMQGPLSGPGDPVLRNCEDIAALEPVALNNGKRFNQHMRAAERTARETFANPRERDEFLRGMRQGAEQGGGGRESFRRSWELSADVVREAAQMCRVLARGGWRESGGQLMFDSIADMNEFNAASSRLNASNDQIIMIQDQAKAQAQVHAEQLRQMAR